MKKLIMCLTFLFLTQTYAQNVLPINPAKSEIKWSCDYSFYFNGHYGFVKFKQGYFEKTKDKITGGSFIIDLHTLEATDMEADGNEGLTKHLKDPDFFEVDKFPTATLVIKKTTYHSATTFEAEADMTIKGITKPVKFKAELDFEKKTMKTRFKIDRTRWGINYNSTLKDSAISDAIGFEVTISL